MQPDEQLSALLELAREAGLVVRVLPRSAVREGEPSPASGLCRVRDEHWVLLAAADPVARRIDALVDGLRRCRGEFLDQHYLAPALRALMEGDSEGEPGTG